MSTKIKTDIRALLTKNFSNDELRKLIIDNTELRPVFEQLRYSMGKGEVVNRLVEYADQEGLLSLLWALAQPNNPDIYKWKVATYARLVNYGVTISPTASNKTHVETQNPNVNLTKSNLLIQGEFTPEFLKNELAPFLDMLAGLQHTIDAIKNESSSNIRVSDIRNIDTSATQQIAELGRVYWGLGESESESDD